MDTVILKIDFELLKGFFVQFLFDCNAQNFLCKNFALVNIKLTNKNKIKQTTLKTQRFIFANVFCVNQ